MDVRRIVRPGDDWGAPDVVIDLDDGAGYQTVRDTWVVTPPPRKPQVAVSERRYGGSRTVGETHDNGMLAWTTLVSGATSDQALDRMSALLGVLESVVPGLYLEWRPDGATNSVYSEIRGPAVWKPNYVWAQFAGAHSLTCEIQLPVAPLALEAPMILGPYTIDAPAVIELDETIPGDAPALMDVQITTPEDLGDGLPEPAWALLGWSQRPTGDLAPFGLLADDEYGSTFTADYVLGSWRDTAPGGAAEQSLSFLVTPSRVPSDAFIDGELTVEVWGRFELNDSLVNPRATVRCGRGNLVRRPTLEFGDAGRSLVKPSSGSAFRFSRLGTLVLTEDVFARIHLRFEWDDGTGDVGFDYLMLVPVAQRALGPTGKPLDTAYPIFYPAVDGPGEPGQHGSKVVLNDLSGYYNTVPELTDFRTVTRHTGLGGSPMEIPAGDVDLLVKLSMLVPDDPTSDTSSEQATHDGIEVAVRVWPRWLLARGA